MAKKGKGNKPIAEMTDVEIVQLVVDVVRRLRRWVVSEHLGVDLFSS